MPASTPPTEIWIQFSLIAILVLVTLLIAGGFYRLWKDLLKWMEQQEAKRDAEREKQDAKREEEREKQRVWETEQSKQRDAQWQEFLSAMQAEWVRQDKRNTDVLESLVRNVQELTVAVNNHDTWTRSADLHAPVRARKP